MAPGAMAILPTYLSTVSNPDLQSIRWQMATDPLSFSATFQVRP